ncbi:MAG: outer membrane lipoprotein-sorting protein [Candidatus Rokuibacteriota bacterium]
MVAALVALVVAPRPTDATGEPPPDAMTLWQRSLVVQRLPDVRSEITLATTLKSGRVVTLRLRGLSRLQPNGVQRSVMTRVVESGNLGGAGFLSIEQPHEPSHLWIYLPGLGRPRRLVGGNLRDSYLGSEFRYGDLVQPDPDDYRATLRGPDAVGGREAWVIETEPREPVLARDTGLGRQVRWLAKDTGVELRVEQHDPEGTLVKVLDNDRWMAAVNETRWMPRERRIRNVQTGAESKATWDAIEVGVGIDPSLFSPVKMGDRSW